MSAPLLFTNLKSQDISGVQEFTNAHLECSYPVGFFLQFLYTRGSLCLQLRSEQEPNKILGVISGKLVSLDNQKYDGHIYTLAVEPAARRLGLGSKLIKEFEQKMRRESNDRLTFLSLDIRSRDQNALNFYKTQGFQFLNGERIKNYYPNDDAYKLVKPIL